MTSDAAYRFERGVAWKTVETGANRTTDLILSIAGGKVVGRKDAVAKAMDLSRREVSIALEDIQKQLGAPLELARAEKILKRLGCIVSVSQNKLNVITPHYRNDLKIKEDIVEELARIVGYDNLPMSLPHVSALNIPVDLERERFFSRVADNLVGQGLHQIMTYALISRDVLKKARYEGITPIALQNPMSAEQEVMRPTMLPCFLTVAADNIHRGQKDLKLFEVAKRYLPDGERWTLGILMTGKRDNDWRRAKKEPCDLYDVKGAIEELCAKLRVQGISFAPAKNQGIEPGQCAEVLLKGKTIGRLGRVADEIVADWDIKKAAICFAEVDLESILDAVAPREKYAFPAEFPAVTRDLSLAVKEGTASFADLRALCEVNGQGLLQRIDFVELYTGDKMETGCKGYVLSLTYQSRERTLTDDEVNALHEGIIRKLIEKFGVKQR
jgi:phenylalanyl-tRNA synthetase beta chain